MKLQGSRPRTSFNARWPRGRGVTLTWAICRLAGLLAMIMLPAVILSCIDRPLMDMGPGVEHCMFLGDTLHQRASNDVDILLVIDNSGSMAEEQALLMEQFHAMISELKSMAGGLPSLHIGVTSSNLGTNPFPITYCESPGGDKGNLLTGGCHDPVGRPFIVDVEPWGCEISKNDSGVCSDHGCGSANCYHELSTALVTDPSTGCPRCRNYSGQLDDTFACIANLGITGCGFEQHLEAMYKALSPENTYNRGFVRENAVLAVIFLADEDDCSASDPQLFDYTQNSMDSPLGPLTSYRCFEHGIQCDQSGRDAQGTRTNCRPREDDGALLHPVSRYVSFLRSIKDPHLLVMAGILGPVTDNQVTIGLDEYGQPKLMPSCSSTGGTADPAIRFKAVIEAMNTPDDMVWAMTSICSPTFADAFEGIGRKIKSFFDISNAQCLPSPLRGCSDPGAELGQSRDIYSGNDVCLAVCDVMDIFGRGLPTETKSRVSPCLEVCPQGPCPGNTDRAWAYRDAHPPPRDGSLPVSACWHINYQPMCEESNYAEMIISRREDPPPRSLTTACCQLISQAEQLCNDGVDNDEDGLIDMDDPDCMP